MVMNPASSSAPSEPPTSKSAPFDPRAAEERFNRMLRGLDGLLAVTAVALAFLMASFAARNSDLWMHLAAGRLIANGQYSFGTDPFCYGTENLRWVNPAWLTDWLMYQAYARFGPDSLVVIKAGLLAALAVVMLRAGRPRTGPAAGWVSAVLVGLAAVASAPRWLLQPVVASYLLFGITLLLLLRGRRRLPLYIAIVCALWANLDGWFLLGPLTVLLFLLGTLLQRAVPFGAEPAADDPTPLDLTNALAAGLGACVLNPHHVFVFTALPPELNPGAIVETLRTEALFRQQFMSPLDSVYTDRPELGYSFPGAAYALLLAVGLGSFALNYRQIRWPLTLVWLGTAALSLYNWRMIPFFAVAAAPIAALNVAAFRARRAAAAPDPVPESTTPQPAGVPGGGVALTPARIRAFVALMGRLMTFALGAVALWAAWPGWLHPTAPPHLVRRVEWRLAPDPSMVKAAQTIQSWRTDGRLPADARGLHFQPDFVNYCAWYAPDEKGFFDYRYGLIGNRSADFATVRTGLRELAKNGSTFEAWDEVMRAYDITHVVIDMDRSEDDRLFAVVMWHYPEEWPLWYLDGQVAVMGHNDPQRRSAPRPKLERDLLREAFGPNVPKVPAPKLREASGDDTAPPREFWDRYLTPPAVPSPDALEAFSDLIYRDAVLRLLADRYKRAFEATGVVTEIGVAAADPLQRLLAGVVTYQSRQAAQGKEPLPAAPALLAIRAARRGIAADPDSPYPYFALAQAYKKAPGGGDLRQMQIVAALRMGLARTPGDTYSEQRLGGLVTDALLDLFSVHFRMRRYDLALEYLGRALDRFEKYPPTAATVPPEELEQTAAGLKQQRDDLDKHVSRQRDNYELEVDRMRGRGTLREKVVLAIRMDLFGRGLKELYDADPKQRDLRDVDQLIKMLLAVGRVEDASTALDQFPAADQPPELRTQFWMHHINAAILRGDFVRAATEWDASYGAYLRRDPDPRKQMFTQLGTFLNNRLTSEVLTDGLPRLAGELIASQPETILRLQIQQEANFLAIRGLAALEYGDTPAARAFLRKSLELAGPIGFDNREAVERYLTGLDKELK